MSAEADLPESASRLALRPGGYKESTAFFGLVLNQPHCLKCEPYFLMSPLNLFGFNSWPLVPSSTFLPWTEEPFSRQKFAAETFAKVALQKLP